jgi:peptidyl-prolyl cis-trans isomerase B (cyclophilin B)
VLLKTVVSAALLAALVLACGRSNEKPASGTQSETTTTTATSSTTAENTSGGTTPATVPAQTADDQEKPMSDYEGKVAELHTSKGEIDIRFFPEVAPNHVRNFLELAEKGFYNGTKFHRVIPGFMIQGGDPNTISGAPNTWGMGGSPKKIAGEFSSISHKRGIVSMARSQDRNSASSQFFIVVKDSTFLDKEYTVFGQVTKGMEVADAIVNAPSDSGNNRPKEPVTIDSIVIRPATEAENGPAPK